MTPLAPTPRIAVLPDRRVLAEAAARATVERARAAADHKGSFTWVLAGGGTPRDLYALLADPRAAFRGEMPWQQTHVFWGDERHVPPDHPDSNFRMAREAMLDAVPLPPRNIHRIPAEEADAARAADLYEAELRAFFAHDLWPRFDLVLLGLGADAHTASLFPGSPILAECSRWVAAPYVPALASFRITLTPPAIDHAAAVLFLVAGEDKAAAVRAVIEGDEPPALRPARVIGAKGASGAVSAISAISAIRPADPGAGELLWLIDHAAARDLSKS
jgi:6-phosphogluconolactonase